MTKPQPPLMRWTTRRIKKTKPRKMTEVAETEKLMKGLIKDIFTGYSSTRYRKPTEQEARENIRDVSAIQHSIHSILVRRNDLELS